MVADMGLQSWGCCHSLLSFLRAVGEYSSEVWGLQAGDEMNDLGAVRNTMQQNPDFMAETHAVENVPPPLEDYDSWQNDAALREAVTAFGGGWGEPRLAEFGVASGSAERIGWGRQANENPPRLHTHDRYGHRVDEVEYHPAYHQLMTVAKANYLHALPWVERRAGTNVVRAALLYLQSQVEAGHGCPVVMTFACVPTLNKQPDIAAQWLPGITNPHYDPSNRVYTEKRGLTVGMAMTEKQGGSDVRANSTQALPLGAEGPGRTYELVGHKYFVSAPMSDAFLMLAYTERGLSCFLVPRWRPDGSRNALQIIRLKDKMGNVSNASCETELRGALGWMIGAEGRGVANIIEMVALTRFDCAVASAAGMRQAAVQALHHCAYRSAFGARLAEQPLMQSVLADLALEAEAATWLGLRLAQALDRAEEDEGEALLARIGTAVAKYWNCKRAPGHAYERRNGNDDDAAPVPRGAGQRDLGRQRQRAVPGRVACHAQEPRDARCAAAGDRPGGRRASGAGRAPRRTGPAFGGGDHRARPCA
jgi:putative acyl-CoA dehydrogenase